MNLEKGIIQIKSKERKILIYTEPGALDPDKVIKNWFKRLPDYQVIFVNIIKNK